MKNIFYFLALAIFIVSCSKDEPLLDEFETENHKSETNTLIDKVAKSVALSLNNDDFSDFLDSELASGWADENQVLLKDILGKSYNEKGHKVSTLFTKNLFSNMLVLSENKKLRILTTEFSIRNFNLQNNNVVVFVSPLNDSASEIIGYKKDGTKIILDASIEPDFPVLIVGLCEVCDDDGNLIALFNDSSKTESVNLRDSRISGRQEYITYLRTPDLNYIEKWWNGKPEIRYVAVLSTGASPRNAYEAIFRPTRHNAKNGILMNASMFNWYFNEDDGPNNGPDYYLQTFEQNDTGTSQSLNVGLSVKIKGETVEIKGTTYSIEYKENDKRLWGRLITYADESPQTYSSGLLQTTIENKN